MEAGVRPPRVSLMVPCFNEAAALPGLLERLADMNGRLEAPWAVLFVDDGSMDATFALLEEAARSFPWLRVVRHGRNLGLGAALRTGLANLESPIVCTADADGTCPLEVYPALVKLVEEGADVAIGSPWHPASDPPECGLGRRILSRGASLAYRLATGRALYSWTSIARAYRRAALAQIPFRSDGFDAVAEILLGAVVAGLEIREVPMKLGVRRQGRSKINIAAAIGGHLVLVARAAAQSQRRWWRRFR